MKFVLDDEELNEQLSRLTNPDLLTGNFFDAEMASVMFMTDLRTIDRIVPKPLKPTAIPFATAFFAKYPKTDFGSVYNEAALSLGVEYEGEIGAYCLTMPVTEDMALILGREIFGFPKKMADEISLKVTENRLEGRYVRKGIELMSLSMAFDKEVEQDEFFETLSKLNPDNPVEKELNVVSYNFKFFRSPELTGFDYKPRLVKQITSVRPSGKIKLSTNFDLKLRSSDCDFLGEIPVKDPIIGFYGIFNNTMYPGKVIAEVGEEQFMRYSYSKIDFLTS